jgi:hypothetical protein
MGAAAEFFKRVRWRDWHGAAELVVPERRGPFEKARLRDHDDKDLQITDYELVELRALPAGRVQVIAKLSWIRLPSVTEKTETTTSLLVSLGNAWFVAQQDVGPFAPELEAPYLRPKP